MLFRSPALSGVSAVRERRVYRLPHGGYRWDPGSHESHLTFLWAANVLHPEHARFDLRSEVRTFYTFLYGQRPDEDALDRVLALPANRDARGYAAAFGRSR